MLLGDIENELMLAGIETSFAANRQEHDLRTLYRRSGNLAAPTPTHRPFEVAPVGTE